MATVSIKEQLGQLKALTERFGTLHEAQLLQIRNYPLLIPGIKTAETTIDMEKKIINYKCKSNPKKKFRKTKQVMSFLDHIYEWCKYVSWSDVTLEVKVDGKDIFDSRSIKS